MRLYNSNENRLTYVLKKCRRLLASLLDLVFFLFYYAIFGRLSFSNDLFIQLFCHFALYEFLRSLLLWRYGRTVGKYLMRIKYKPIGKHRLILRLFARYGLQIFYIFTIWFHIFDKANPFMEEQQSIVVMDISGSVMMVCYYICFICIYTEIIYMFFSRSNQYLRDRLLGFEIDMG